MDSENTQFTQTFIPPPVPVALKHSGLGIASFVLSVVGGILTFLVVVVAGVMSAGSPDGLDENSAQAIVIGLFIIGFAILDVIALGLGIAALQQKDRKQTFSILGMVFAGCTVLGVIGLMIVGTVAK